MVREHATLRVFRELTRLEVWRERLRECIRVAVVSGVDPFGSTEGAFKGVYKGCGCFRA